MCRDCSAAFHLAPSEGKHEPPDQAPDGLQVQQLQCENHAAVLVRRDCSAAFHLAPYEGKYEAPDQAPDALQVQRLQCKQQ